MSVNFRKSMKVAPGVRVSLSKSGASVSVGAKGARVSMSKRGVTTTTGISGTGIYNRDFKSWDKMKANRQVRLYNQSKEETEAFYRNPFLMILSIIFLVLSVFSLILPGIPFWLFFPSIILFIGFYVCGMQKK